MLAWEPPSARADWRSGEISCHGFPVLGAVWLVVSLSVVWRFLLQRPAFQGPRVPAAGYLPEAMLALRESYEGT